MLASILITNYNYGKYLSTCLRSCINQTLQNSEYEIILIDDCSTDNSVKIGKQHKPYFKNLRIIENKKNSGVAFSSNIGIKNAKGKYVIRVDADDFINSELLRILIYFLEEYKEYFNVACDYYLVNYKTQKIMRLSSKDYPISCGVLYRKSPLLKLGGYNNNYRHREEEELRERIVKKNLKTYNLNFPLYRYRMHKSNKTKQKDYKDLYLDKINKIRFKENFNEYKKKAEALKKNVVVIIPARGGSKRLKNKNLFKVWNKPMIYWSVNAAKNSAFIKSIFVSSEDKNILNYAKKIKVNTIKRPKFLSRDNVFKMKAVQHAYKEICKKEKPSLIISLQANSPNMRTFDIDKCIEKLISNNLNEVISTDINYNQNGAIRVMLPSTVLQDSLSTHCGFLITDISDVHTIDDIKKLNKKNNKN